MHRSPARPRNLVRLALLAFATSSGAAMAAKVVCTYDGKTYPDPNTACMALLAKEVPDNRFKGAELEEATGDVHCMGTSTNNTADYDMWQNGISCKPGPAAAAAKPATPAKAQPSAALREPSAEGKKYADREGGLTYMANQVKGRGQGKGATVEVALAEKDGKQFLVAGINSGSKGLTPDQLKQLDGWGINVAPTVSKGMQGAPHAEENIAAYLQANNARGVRWSKAVVGSQKPGGSSYVCTACRSVIKQVGGRVEE